MFTKPPRFVFFVVLSIVACSLGNWGGEPANGQEVDLSPPPGPYLTGEKFEAKLDSVVPGVAWHNPPVERVLRNFADREGLSVVLDRRIDPAKPVNLEVGSETVRKVLNLIAAQVGAEVVTLGSVVYVGPPDHARILDELVEIGRHAATSARGDKLAKSMLQPHDFAWGDLTPPREILQQICDSIGMVIVESEEDIAVREEVATAPNGLPPNQETEEVALTFERIPHDLWRGAVLPDVDIITALTLVLGQFDLVCARIEDTNQFRLVPMTPEMMVPKTYLTDGKQKARTFLKRFPLSELKAKGRLWTITASLRDHHEIRAWFAGEDVNANDTDTPVVPLEDRSFTLSTQDAPVRSIMTKLETTGIKFDFDDAAIRRAGINLSQRISIDIREAKADRFFREIFEPLGLRAEYSGVTVKLIIY
ncbi:hypothetical protein [Calycomorphotria hydatis]|uniref:Uncharacterized protein n=1 Tax=Calycomorphotria hydatis TaxID=2528027 RepID=A0A517TCW5_9PLAN|nr:hypothetical protein [Calycomorphotria hydatis]QDT66208.1 hypothetical protein V22_34730 [Calycomorphotria hydatis]